MILNIPVINFIIALLFLISFYMKVVNIENFKYEIASYNVLPKQLLLISAISILIYEFFLVILFCLGLLPMIKEILGITLMCIFTLITIKKRKSASSSTCACFGNDSLLNKFPVTRNIIISILMVINLMYNVDYSIGGNSLLIVFLLSSIVLVIDISQTIQKYKQYIEFYE